MNLSRKADLSRLIARHDCLEALEKLRAVTWHEMDDDLRAKLDRRVMELKERGRVTGTRS